MNKKNFKIGVVGSHRVGKTTLCNSLIKYFPGMKNIHTHVSQHPVWTWYNTNPDDYVSFETRLNIQAELITYLSTIIEENNDFSYILDRTPLDAMTYLYCNIDSDVTDTYKDIVDSLENLVIRHTNKLDLIIFLFPGIEKLLSKNELFVEGKNQQLFQSYIYRNALTNHMLGFITRYIDTNVIIVPENIIKLDQRIQYILENLV